MLGLSSLPKIHFKTIGESSQRDRVDLTIDNRSGEYRLGLFNQDYSEIVDLTNCPQLSKALQEWLHDFRHLKPEIMRGSVRLRVSPSGQRGVWLDLANVDVKKLLDDPIFLRALKAQAFVEIGQKRKALIEKDGQLKLGNPQPHPWFETYIWENEQLRAQPLLGCIGGFTQPGFAANRALVEVVLKILKTLKVKRAIEFGSGVGNFTLPLASFCETVDALELEPLACESLSQNLVNSGLQHKVTIHQGDFQKLSARQIYNFSEAQLVFVDPPRSGLKDFLSPLYTSPIDKPNHFIYVSCFLESFLEDIQKLRSLGYRCEEITLVDQFPQTPHIEIVALLTADITSSI